MPAKIERSCRTAATKPVTGLFVRIHDTLRIKIRSKGGNVAPTLNFFLPFIQTDSTGFRRFARTSAETSFVKSPFPHRFPAGLFPVH